MNSDFVWLPYTQMKNHLPQLEVESAKGCEIYLKNGKTLLDGISSWWSVAHGYSHPELILAIKNQAEKLSHIMLAGFENEQTYNLAQRLCQKTGLYSCFFSDSGSTAVEVAMKISWQYFINLKHNKKTKFISFKNSYHGDTSGAMSLADLESGMHKKFKPLLLDNFSVKLPKNFDELNEFEEFVKKHQDQVAAIFIEPLVQCAGGMKFFETEILSEIFKIAKANNILTVADEAAVGFYRVGKFFACDFIEQKPDIMVLGKALTGGMMTLAATLVSQEIYHAFLDDNLDSALNSALMHGPTFMGNPLASSVANASLDLFEKNDYQTKVAQIEKILKDGLLPFNKFENVKNVRVLGAIGVVETDFDFDKMLKMRQKSVELQVFLRPFAGVIYLMPPLIVEKIQLEKMINVVAELLR